MASWRSGDLHKHLQDLFQVGTVGGLADAQLLEKLLNRRADDGEYAFRVLMERHGPMVLRVCRSVLGDPHDAEDAFQVTFLVLATKAATIRSGISLGSWLHGVALRVARKSKTIAGRRRGHEARAATMTVSSSPADDGHELSPALHQELGRLPEKYRAPIVLCYLEGKTHESAANELGWPVGTVRGRLARARELLKIRLTRRGLTFSAGLIAADPFSKIAPADLPAALIASTIRAVAATAASSVFRSTAVLVLESVLRDMALVRRLQVTMPLVLAALVATSTAIFVSRGEPKLAVDHPLKTKAATLPRPRFSDQAGDRLPGFAVARLGTAQFVHSQPLEQIVYAPDGATIALAGGGDLSLWDAATGRDRLHVHKGPRNGNSIGAVFAPDGRLMAVRDTSETSVYDTVSGRETGRFERKGFRACLAFSPDGKILAEGFSDVPTVLWDIASGRSVRTFDHDSQGAMALAFGPDGKLLISCVSWQKNRARLDPHDKVPRGPGESSIQFWDVESGKEVRRIGLGPMRIKQVALAPDGQSLAIAANDPAIRLWGLTAGREIRRFGPSGVATSGLAFSSDGKILASGEASKGGKEIWSVRPNTTAIHLWDTGSGRELRRIEVRATSMSSLVFAPDDSTLAFAGGRDQVMRRLDLARGQEDSPPYGHLGSINDVAFARDGKLIVTAGNDRTVRFWNPIGGKEIRRLEASDDSVCFTALSADAKTMATGGFFQPTRLWAVESGRELRRFQIGKQSYVSHMDLSPDGKTLVTAEGNDIVFWDTSSGQRRASLSNPPVRRRMSSALAFAPDGKSVASIADDYVYLWDASTARETRRIMLPNAPRSRGFQGIDPMQMVGARLAFSLDAKIIAASSERDGTIFLLEAASGKEIARFEGSKSRLKALALSPDGRILAKGAGTVRQAELCVSLWDVTTQKELGRVKAHRAFITALAFSPDGRRIVSVSEDATALVWDVAAVIAASQNVNDDRRTAVISGN